MNKSVCAGLLVWASVGAALAQQPAAPQPVLEKPVALNLPSEPLEDALHEFSRVTGLKVMLYSNLGRGVTAPAVQGTLTPQAALELLLKGSELRFEYLDAQTIAVLPLHDPGNVTNSTSSTQDSAPQLDEIVVTAQKKEERLQDTPVPVAVLNANTLAESSQVLIRDYASSVPGFAVTPGIYPGSVSVLTIRGINSGGGVPSVGVVIDDVPYGSSYGGHTGADVPDIDPGDLARIEVLRGPQGTLYGAGSMGGLVKFVTKDPSTTGFSSRVEVGTDYVANGAEPGFDARASANIPINDNLAVRVSAFTRQDAGYIDNVISRVNGVNEGEASGGRVSLWWRLSEDFSLKLSALYQHVRTNGAPDADVLPGLGDLKQNYIPTVAGYPTGLGGNLRTDQLYSAVLKGKFAGIELISVSAFGRDYSYNSLDYSYAFGGFSEQLFQVPGAPFYNYDSTKTLSEEFRLSSSLWNKLDWQVGAFYSRELENDLQISDAATAAGVVVGPGAVFQNYYEGSPKFQEYAAFVDLTYHFTDRFSLEVGGRQSHISLAYPTNMFALAGPPIAKAAVSSSSTPFTYLVTPQFKVGPDLMLYARFASGFRPGSPNAPLPGVPGAMDPDTTQTYETGIKGDFLHHTLSLDASLYYIDYSKIQLTVRVEDGMEKGTVYGANGGQAKSEGLELSLTSRPLTGLTISGWVDYDDAVLTQSFPGNSTVYGASGNRLPGSSRWSVSVSVEQEFPLPDSTIGFVGAAANYVGDRVGNFQGAGVERQLYPSYTRADLRAGVRYNAWTVNLYANNIANVRGELGGGLDAAAPYSFTFIQPRTLGVSVARQF